MIVFRLSKAKYSNDISGKGAERSGGRWNSKGMAMLYTSQSRALCITEVAVHSPLGIIPTDYELISISIPDDTAVLELKATDLPADWKSFPHANSTQMIGDEFILKAKYLVLMAPSVVVAGDYNYLVNPRHKDFYKVAILQIEPFEFDKRLFVK